MGRTKCETKAAKKKFDTTRNRRWNLAICEAEVLKCIDLTKRISAYETILKDLVISTDNKIRIDRRHSNGRCDTPQTIDTAYSSMKQSASPATINPSLNELDKKFDVQENLDKYFNSIDGMSPVYEDSLNSFSSLSDSTTNSSESLTISTVESIFNQLNQPTVCNEADLMTALQLLWKELHTIEMAMPKSRRSRIISIDSVKSVETTESADSSFKQTKRQQSLAMKNEIAKRLASQRSESEPSPKRPRIDSEAKKQEKILLFEAEVEECFLRRHPANYLLKKLTKDPVCEYCLQPDDVHKCVGECNGYFHVDCMQNSLSEEHCQTILKKKKKPNKSSPSNESIPSPQQTDKKCLRCSTAQQSTACLVCKRHDGGFIKCSDKFCSNIFHEECLTFWPKPEKLYNKANKQIESLCPRHICHTCHGLGNKTITKTVMKCLLCPATYHRASACIPAGCQLLSEQQLICAKHYSNNKGKQINIDFCLFCSEGGSLICCDTCPFAFHLHCLPKISIGDQYICEGCESGRRPLYGEIVWAKYGYVI